ncbi:MAG TPA: EamA family transporter [Terracidiphilus sp.]|nr:EamA family transporter [Terracidiphilus sp.]
MPLGYLYMILSLTSFGLIGITAKFADTRNCRPSAIYTMAYAWSLLFGALFVLVSRHGDFHVPAVVYAIALPFGAAGAIGGIVFMSGIRYGKISTSWLIINLSAAIPAVGSIAIYHEQVSPRKIAVLILAVVAVLLLWKDKQMDEARATQTAQVPGDSA